MNVNLIMDTSLARRGFLNICPLAQEETEDPKVVIADVFNLEQYVDAAECECLIANHILSRVPFAAIPGTVAYWRSKIARNGALTIIDHNLGAVIDRFHRDDVSDEQMNQILYGHNHVRRSCVSADLIVDCMKGFSVTQKQLNGITYIITAERL